MALQITIPSVCAGFQVFQVKRKGTGQVYAMKVMRKEHILARDHSDYVRAEREVLTAVFHPYIVTLRCSFQVGHLQSVHTCNHGLTPNAPHVDCICRCNSQRLSLTDDAGLLFPVQSLTCDSCI